MFQLNEWQWLSSWALRLEVRKGEQHKGEASVYCFPPPSPPFRKGECFINIVRFWRGFIWAKEEEEKKKFENYKGSKYSSTHSSSAWSQYCSIFRIGIQFNIISKFLWHYLGKGKCGSRKLPRTGIGLFLGCTRTLRVSSVVSRTKRWSGHGYS